MGRALRFAECEDEVLQGFSYFDVLTGVYSRVFVRTGSEVPLLSFAARLRACRNLISFIFPQTLLLVLKDLP